MTLLLRFPNGSKKTFPRVRLSLLIHELSPFVRETAKMKPVLKDYSLKCVKGEHKGKFFFVNLDSKGDLIGSGVDPKKDLTLTISNVGLDPLHCRVCFKKDRYYISNFSTTGTWIEQSSLDPIYIYDNMHVKIHSELYEFTYDSTIVLEFSLLFRF